MKIIWFLHNKTHLYIHIKYTSNLSKQGDILLKQKKCDLRTHCFFDFLRDFASYAVFLAELLFFFLDFFPSSSEFDESPLLLSSASCYF